MFTAMLNGSYLWIAGLVSNDKNTTSMTKVWKCWSNVHWTWVHTKRKVVIPVVIKLSPIDNFWVVRVVPKKTSFCPPSQRSCTGGYFITLRPSFRHYVSPSVRPFPLNNFKSFGRNLMPSHTSLLLGGFRTLYEGYADWPILCPIFGPIWPTFP